MRNSLHLFVLGALMGTVAYPGTLKKIGEVDLTKLIEDSKNTGERWVSTLGFSPAGDRLAIVLTVEPGPPYRNPGHVIVLDSKDPYRVVETFRLERVWLTGMRAGPIQWSSDGNEVSADHDAFAMGKSAYCGWEWIRGFLGGRRVLAETSRTIPGDRLERKASQLSILGPGCADEHPLFDIATLEFFDFMPDRNVGVFRRQASSRHWEIIAMDFPGATVRRSWPSPYEGTQARLVNDATAVCMGVGIYETDVEPASCWSMETGDKIGDVPAKGGWPIMPATKSPRIIASDWRWRSLMPDWGYEVLRRRVLWDYSLAKEIASWKPPKQSHVRDKKEGAIVYPCALSPDGKTVAEAGDGVLRIYRVSE